MGKIFSRSRLTRLSNKLIKSLGVTRVLFSFFGQNEIIRFQSLSKWFYNVAIGRVQTKLHLRLFDLEYFFYDVVEPGKLLRF